jgi:hypothetical protein
LTNTNDNGDVTPPPLPNQEILECSNEFANAIKRILSFDKEKLTKIVNLQLFTQLGQENILTNPIGLTNSFGLFDILQFFLTITGYLLDEKKLIIIYFLLKNDYAHDGLFKSKLQIKDIHIVQFTKSTLYEHGIIQDATKEEMSRYILTLPKGHINVKNIFKFTPLAQTFFNMIGVDVIESLVPDHIIKTVSSWKKESDESIIQKIENIKQYDTSSTSTTTKINNTPLTKEKKSWDAYCVLEDIAKKRDYGSIGLQLAIGILQTELGKSKRVATETLRTLSKRPYEYISINDGQIYVKPLEELKKALKNMEKS